MAYGGAECDGRIADRVRYLAMKQCLRLAAPKLLYAAVAALCIIGVTVLVIVIGNSHVAGRPAAGHNQSSRASSNTVVSPSPIVDQQALQACIAEQTVNCAEAVPGLAQCMAEKRTDCNQSAAQQMLPAQIESASGAPMTEATAISEARRLHPAAAASASAVVKQMSLSQYVAADPNEAGAFPGLSLARLVWVVTIHASVPNDPPGGQAATLMPYYTVVFDVASGQTLVECLGCETAG